MMGTLLWQIALASQRPDLAPRVELRSVPLAWRFRVEWLHAADAAEGKILVAFGTQALEDPAGTARDAFAEAAALLDRAWVAAQRQQPCSE